MQSLTYGFWEIIETNVFGIVFNNFTFDFEDTIKKAAELQTGILTQCIKSLTVEKNLKLATLVNILLKVNAKLDGTNHSLDKNTR